MGQQSNELEVRFTKSNELGVRFKKSNELPAYGVSEFLEAADIDMFTQEMVEAIEAKFCAGGGDNDQPY